MLSVLFVELKFEIEKILTNSKEMNTIMVLCLHPTVNVCSIF